MAAKIFGTLTKSLYEYKGTVINTAMAGGTILFEEILNRVLYYCPCVEPQELIGCNSTSNSASSFSGCTKERNFIYGLLYILAPGIVLFFIALASTPRIWKLWTGYCYKDDQTRLRKGKIAWTVLSVVTRSVIPPVVWICYALLDGKYYSCLSTPLPYDVGPGASYETCTQVARTLSPTHSDAYRDNRSHSQFYGWAVVAVSVVVGFTIYAISRCVYPLTYYHAKYYDFYTKHEENEFDQEMNVKAQKEAEKNVLQFMSKFRDKALWDRISCVYSFHRNPENMALYSYLHEFILQENSMMTDIHASSSDEAESVVL